MNDLRIALAKGDEMEWRCIAWICMSRFITLPRHTSMEEKKREAANLFTHRLLLPFSTEASLRCVYIYLHKRSFKARGYFLDPASLTLYIYFLPSSKKLESSIFFDQRYSRSHNTCDRCFCLFEGLWRICSGKNEFGIILNYAVIVIMSICNINFVELRRKIYILKNLEDDISTTIYHSDIRITHLVIRLYRVNGTTKIAQKRKEGRKERKGILITVDRGYWWNGDVCLNEKD